MQKQIGCEKYKKMKLSEKHWTRAVLFHLREGRIDGIGHQFVAKRVGVGIAWHGPDVGGLETGKGG